MSGLLFTEALFTTNAEHELPAAASRRELTDSYYLRTTENYS
jgi:hypothetical protein